MIVILSTIHYMLPQLLRRLNQLNNDPDVHGIIVQMPLDSVNKIDSTVSTMCAMLL